MMARETSKGCELWRLSTGRIARVHDRTPIPVAVSMPVVATICGNARLAVLDQVDEGREVLAKEVLRPNVIEAALDAALKMLRADAQAPERSATAVKRWLAEVERRLANLTATAARGGAVLAIIEALNRADCERQALQAELAAIAKTARRSAWSCEWFARDKRHPEHPSQLPERLARVAPG